MPNAASTPSWPCCSAGTPVATKLAGLCDQDVVGAQGEDGIDVAAGVGVERAPDQLDVRGQTPDLARLLEVVVAPEQLVADRDGRDAVTPRSSASAVFSFSRSLIVVALDAGGDLVRSRPASRRRREHVVELGKPAALDERLAERGEAELALAAELLRHERGPQRGERPALDRPDLGRREGRQAAIGSPRRDLLDDRRRVQVREPLVELAELVEQDRERDRPPLGARNELVDALGREVGVRRVEVVVEDRVRHVDSTLPLRATSVDSDDGAATRAGRRPAAHHAHQSAYPAGPAADRPALGRGAGGAGVRAARRQRASRAASPSRAPAR